MSAVGGLKMPVARRQSIYRMSSHPLVIKVMYASVTSLDSVVLKSLPEQLSSAEEF